MKILFPIGSFYPAQRGPANTVYWLTKALNKKGVEVTVITTNNHIEKEDLVVDTYIETEVGKVIYYREKNYKFPLKMIYEVFKEIKKNDIVHLSSLFFPPALIAALSSRYYKKKVVWSVRGELEDGALKYKSYIKMIYIKLINLCITQDVVFHSTSDRETQNIKKYFPNNNIVALPNYIELPKKTEMAIAKQILFLGRIAPIKALENLIEAVFESKKFRQTDFTLKIVGPIDSQQYFDKLENLVMKLHLEEYVFFLPKVTGIEKEKLLAESYFLVLSSHSENFGNVVLEACAQGTPVIASYGTPWEKLREYNAGYWVDNTPSGLSNVFDCIVTLDTETYGKMRENAYSMVNEQFSIEKNIDKWMNIYKGLI